MFRSSLAHHQAVHICIKQVSNRYTIPSIHTVALYREHTQTYRLLQLLCSYPSLYSYFDKLATILHTGDDITVGRLFYTTVHWMMMGQWGPKHVAVCILTHFCNSNEVCGFFGLTAATETVHGMENVNKKAVYAGRSEMFSHQQLYGAKA